MFRRRTHRVTTDDVKGEWKDLVVDVRSEISQTNEKQARGEKIAPYDRPNGIALRHVYGFVREKLKGKHGKYLDYVFESTQADALKFSKRRDRTKPKPSKKYPDTRYKSFSENAFHCALRSLHINIKLFRYDELTRFGRQLLYAHRHDINPHLLVGFLHQTGSIKDVATKACDEHAREEWFREIEEAAKMTAARKSRYPLGVIHFTATSTDSNGCPIEVGFARANGPNAPIIKSSVLIKPPPGWAIAEKWSIEQQNKIRVYLKDLRSGDEAREVIERISELFNGIDIVHCINVDNSSHWLDMLLVAAEEVTDFQLREIGDFIDHNPDKRAKFRKGLSLVPGAEGSAGANAGQVCELLRSVAKH